MQIHHRSFRALWIHTALKHLAGASALAFVLEPSGFTLLSNTVAYGAVRDAVLEPSGFTLLPNDPSSVSALIVVLEPSGFTLLSNKWEERKQEHEF